ncbi:ElyC/SanA/YdcF family protein [Lactiplantibacillus plantarum]
MNDAAVWVPVPAMFYWGWLVPLIFGTIFGWRYHRDKVRLGNGIWFSLFFYSFLTMLAITILGSNIHWLIIISGTLFVLLILLIGLIFTLQAFLLLWNAWIMWRHESHTLANMLTLYLGLAILILPFLGNLLSSHVPQPVSYFLTVFPNLVIFYLGFWFYNYLTMLTIYQFNWPRLRQDYIIVLGAGLLDGDRVSPLLGQRIMRGLRFYQKQQRKTHHRAVMIFSGGQGGDETVLEGQAMLEYAIAHGPVKNPRTIFVTNNYHTFRAGMFAKQAGLKADGIGARTARFFLPDAIIREYIAIFVRNKWWHAVAMLGILIVSLLLTWFDVYQASL